LALKYGRGSMSVWATVCVRARTSWWLIPAGSSTHQIWGEIGKKPPGPALTKTDMLRRPDEPARRNGSLAAEETASDAAWQLDSLTPEQRARIAAPFRRFVAALQQQRRFDAAVAASLERLMRDPNFLARINQLLSPEKDTSSALHRWKHRRQNHAA
jgi:hypothetical protein